MLEQRCLYCGGNASEPGHSKTCDGFVAAHFDGETYERQFDQERLTAQLQRVWSVACDGKWHTLAEYEAVTGDPQPSISARLRDFRKPRWGGHTVNRRARGDRADGLFEYQLVKAERPDARE